MARVEITETVMRPDSVTGELSAVSGSSVQINKRGGGAATLYTTASGSTTIAQPLTTRYGRVEPTATVGGDVWVAPGSYDLVVDGVTTQRFEAALGGGGGGPVAAFKPEDYGAARDGVTDDTAAIKACVAAACAAAVSDGTYYAEVQFSTGIYQLTGSLTQGGATNGNALIPLPVFADTGQKMILVLKGSGDNAPLWHWNQTTVQAAGVVLRTTVTGTNDATHGAASVIGGPTPQHGYGTATNVWSNMLIVVDGIQITVPNNPAICGWDFRGVGQMNFKNGSCLTNATPVTRVAATSAWQFGLATPQNDNNASSMIGKYSAEGLNYGAYIDEHCTVEYFLAIYCVAGIEFGSGGEGTGHGVIIKHACIEACDVGIGAVNGQYPFKITLSQLDFENINFALVNDPSNFLLGRVWTSGVGNGNLLQDNPSGNLPSGVRGAANLSVYDLGRQKGCAGGQSERAGDDGRVA
jgi:hypothetical protein